MTDLTAQRTLVKSPPELWTEVSEIEKLAKHLGELGEIKITKAVPETTVAWEGESISGTVELEQSGWGTKVTFHATVPEPDAPARPEPVEEPEPALAAEPELPAADPAPAPVVDRRGFWARLFGLPPKLEPVEQPVVEAPTLEFEAIVVESEPEPEPEPVARSAEAERVQEILDGTLEALGQAHHRPFSRG